MIELCRLEREWVPSSPGTALYIRPDAVRHRALPGRAPATSLPVLHHRLAGGRLLRPRASGPVRIRIEDKYVRAAPGGLGAVKAAANYAASLMAAEEAKQAGFAQVLWTDSIEHAALEEVGTMNLFVRIGEEFATPELSGTILGGVTRDSVITLLRRWGYAVNERRILVEELLRAQRSGALKEVFGTGTAAVISPVGELGWKGQKFVVADGRPARSRKAVHRHHRHPVRPRPRPRRLDHAGRVAASALRRAGAHGRAGRSAEAADGARRPGRRAADARAELAAGAEGVDAEEARRAEVVLGAGGVLAQRAGLAADAVARLAGVAGLAVAAVLPDQVAADRGRPIDGAIGVARVDAPSARAAGAPADGVAAHARRPAIEQPAVETVARGRRDDVAAGRPAEAGVRGGDPRGWFLPVQVATSAARRTIDQAAALTKKG